ncbi:MAG: DUF4258 domain-containing protein [Phycisphaerae bacterium]
MKFRLSSHAKLEMGERDLSNEIIEDVMTNPQQVISSYGGRKIYQSKIAFDDGKIFLVRAIVKDDINPAVVVTVYRTSKIEKYWRNI